MDLPEPVAPTTRIRPRFSITSEESTGGRFSDAIAGMSAVTKRITPHDRALLPEHVHAEVAQARHGLGEVELAVRLEDLDLLGREHLVGDLLRRLRVHRLRIDRHDRAADLDADSGEPAEMKMSEAFFSAISCRSFSMNMRAPPGVPSVAPQQLVDACLGAGLRVDLLDDHRAIQTIPRIRPRAGCRKRRHCRGESSRS